MADQPLDGAWAKLERAKYHADALRAEILEATNGDHRTIPLDRGFEQDPSAVVYRIAWLPELEDSWGLLVGDAIHNFRCSLDHAWWQLAIRRLGREPTEEEAKTVQFPILSDAKFRNRKEWNGHRFLKYVYRSDARKIEPLQPFHDDPNPDQIHPLAALADLSNVDKHQVVHAVVSVAGSTTARIPDTYIDCKPIPAPDGSAFQIIVYAPGKPPTLGDKIFEIPVTPTGPNPDVDLQTSTTGYIAINETWNLLDVIDWIGEACGVALTRLEPVF